MIAKRVVRRLRESLTHPPIESVLITAYAGTQGPARRVVEVFTPQPKDFEFADRRQADRHGYRWDLCPAEYCQWVHYFGYVDRVFETLCALARVTGAKSAVDVGANVGLYALPLLGSLGAKGRVLAVEANPRTYDRLAGHVMTNGAQDRLRTCQIALGREPGRAVLAGGGDSGKWSLRDGVDSGVEVEVTTLDALLEAEGYSGVDLIKIDVEGFEPEVLLGGRQTLQTHQPILLAELTPAWSEAGPTGEAVALLEELGYRAHEIWSLYDGREVRACSLRELFTRHAGDAQINCVLVPPGCDLAQFFPQGIARHRA